MRSQIYNECLFKLETSEGSGSGASSGDESVSARSSSSTESLDLDFKTPAAVARHRDTPKPPPLIPGKSKHSDMQRDLLTKKNLGKEIDNMMNDRDKRADARNSVMAACPSTPSPVCPETPVAVVAGLMNPELQSTIIEEALKSGTPVREAAGNKGQDDKPKMAATKKSSEGSTEGSSEKSNDKNKKMEDVSRDFECRLKIFLTSEKLMKGEETKWLLWTIVNMVSTFEVNHATGRVTHDPRGKNFMQHFANNKNYIDLTEQLLDKLNLRGQLSMRCAAWTDEEALAETLHVLADKYKAGRDEQKEVDSFMVSRGNLVVEKIRNFFQQVAVNPVFEASTMVVVMLQHKSLYYKCLRSQKKELASLQHYNHEFKARLAEIRRRERKHKDKPDCQESTQQPT